MCVNIKYDDLGMDEILLLIRGGTVQYSMYNKRRKILRINGQRLNVTRWKRMYLFLVFLEKSSIDRVEIVCP